MEGGDANTRARAIAIAIVRALYTFQKICENSLIEVVDVAQWKGQIQNVDKARKEGDVEEEVNMFVGGVWRRKGDTNLA
ncbi:hypothetical protein ACE6H2_010672 [Prunus campanulata]